MAGWPVTDPIVYVRMTRIVPSELPEGPKLSAAAEAGIRQTQERIESAIAGWSGDKFRISAPDAKNWYGTRGL